MESNAYVALAYLLIWFLSTIGFSQQTKTNNVLISINTVSIYYAVYVSVTGIYVTMLLYMVKTILGTRSINHSIINHFQYKNVYIELL
jgi:hypothetical protein